MSEKFDSITEESIQIGDQTLTLQIGKLARAADIAVYGRLGDTCVLVTIVTADTREDIDYLPLHVEYVEKLYAGGRIKGSRWVKREGRPSDDAILKARLIDRSIRPLFPSSYRKSIQIIITLLSVDGINSPEIVAAIAVSSALHCSKIPWNGPISTMRVGHLGENGAGEYVVNPDEAEQKYSSLDLIVSSTKDKVVMIETEAEELTDNMIFEGIQKAQKENNAVIEFIESLRKKAGKEKESFNSALSDSKLITVLKQEYRKEVGEVIRQRAGKEFGDTNATNELISSVFEKYKDEFDRKAIFKALEVVVKEFVKEKVLKTKKRIDERGPDEIRPITCEVSTLPRTHGSAIFQRGETQVLSIVTLGRPSLEQLIESPEGEEAKHYIHHYYMPSYSVGEIGRSGFPSRREVGHGALAERAMEPVLPSEKEFPYTVRVVSEVLSSNGSTSMASTCGSTLALMDAGVPIKSPVAGIALGLYGNPEGDHVIVSDILGIEDFTGDMDFKIAGSEKGITAIQLDVKNDGLPLSVMKEIFEKSRNGRLYILKEMLSAIQKPRTEISKFAPKVIVLTPPAEKIGEIIGPGGRTIRNLIAKTETEIDVSHDGKVTISGFSKDKVKEAAKYIENMIREIEIGEEFEGEVRRILPFGAFVEIAPGKEGMVHVSKMGRGFVKDPSKIVKIGQRVKVRVYQIDNQNRINLEMLS